VNSNFERGLALFFLVLAFVAAVVVPLLLTA
jgi:hypothetical protein